MIEFPYHHPLTHQSKLCSSSIATTPLQKSWLSSKLCALCPSWGLNPRAPENMNRHSHNCINPSTVNQHKAVIFFLPTMCKSPQEGDLVWVKAYKLLHTIMSRLIFVAALHSAASVKKWNDKVSEFFSAQLHYNLHYKCNISLIQSQRGQSNKWVTLPVRCLITSPF